MKYYNIRHLATGVAAAAAVGYTRDSNYRSTLHKDTVSVCARNTLMNIVNALFGRS